MDKAKQKLLDKLGKKGFFWTSWERKALIQRKRLAP